MNKKAKIWCLAILSLMVFLSVGPAVARDEIIYTCAHSSSTLFADPIENDGGWFFAAVPDGDHPSGDIAVGETVRLGGEIDDLVSCWRTGLWIYNRAALKWFKVYPIAPKRVTVGDLGWDDRLEIIGTYENGIWVYYLDGSKIAWRWRQITEFVPTGDIAAGDIDGDGLAEVVAGFPTGTWYWNPADEQWTKITSYNAYNLAVGDMNADGRAEVAGAFETGIWSWDHGTWRRLTGSGFATDRDIAFGDFDGNKKDDLISYWRDSPEGHIWVLWDSGEWEKKEFINYANRVTAGNVRN